MTDRRSSLTLIAPARLHFGLYALGHGDRKFGGVGVMIRPPEVRIEVAPAEAFEVDGREIDRAQVAAERWSAFHSLPLPACRLNIVAALPPHAGLGSGTQLALSVGTALSAFVGRPMDEPQVLARGLARGNRSAVGTYGFAMGGLIAERGWGPEDFFPPLDARIEFPAEWRFVLLRPVSVAAPVFGAEEEQALSTLPPPVSGTTECLIRLAGERLLPAVAAADFAACSEALYEFNRQSGMLYEAVQGGPYNGAEVASTVELCRRLGVRGVGQSSWGPTVFALLPDEGAARDFVVRVAESDCQLQSTIAAACNRGVEIMGRN